MGFSVERQIGTNNSQYLFIGLGIFLALCGAAFLFSASYGYALTLNKNPEYFFVRQLVFLAVAYIGIFVPVMIIPLNFLKKIIPSLTIICLILLVLCLIPGIGITKNGSHRWIGFNSWKIQPSEIFKPVLVLYMAYILSRKKEKLDDVVYGILPPFMLVLIAALLVFLENDFSTAAMIILIALSIMWLSNIRLIFFIACASIFLPLGVLTIFISDYRLMRIFGFIVKNDSGVATYQINSSIRAIMSGGLWGKGLGQGVYKIKSIPEVQSDFILSALSEELGFFGLFLYLILWVMLIGIILKQAKNADDDFTYYALSGIGIYLSTQIVVNMAVVSGIAPTTGIIFPLLSSGGSGVIAVIFSFAVAAKLMRKEA
ncbi:MAG TPA: FtsW/RodA/SpoVE family cell cycle protein [Spirochaetales bacterium]|nr:FtsW/RodA/SpoVE family cell cycle protein [Spirochaetales bacterium]HPD79712.1 FtsW/RodA/SpoVE family cell cycle protein [Spirochaetales bacterium]HRV27708.1 FtsW/RodA/SpoVE family cell cycle protein [Spirochaetia bacterium]